MADKSPRQSSSKKSGKSLKEKRAEKKAKEQISPSAMARLAASERKHT